MTMAAATAGAGGPPAVASKTPLKDFSEMIDHAATNACISRNMAVQFLQMYYNKMEEILKRDKFVYLGARVGEYDCRVVSLVKIVAEEQLATPGRTKQVPNGKKRLGYL